MEAMVLLVTHMAALGFGFAIGRWLGYSDAQPVRDKLGRFVKRGG